MRSCAPRGISSGSWWPDRSPPAWRRPRNSRVWSPDSARRHADRRLDGTVTLVPAISYGTIVEIVIFVAGVVWTFAKVRAAISVQIAHLREDMMERDKN